MARIFTVAGNYNLGGGTTGNGGAATSATLQSPRGVVSSNGNLYISDLTNSLIRKVSSSGVISTYAGTTTGYSGDGGVATAAQLNYPVGIALDSSDNLYIAEMSNNLVRKVTPGGIISTYAGYYNNKIGGSSGDGGQATSALLNNPTAVAIDSSGNLYITDRLNYVIRKVTSSGIITTIAGTHTQGYCADGTQATSCQIFYPYGIDLDRAGKLYSLYKHS